MTDDLIAAIPTGLLIDGEWRPAVSGRHLGVEDPATGKTLAQVADAGAEDVDAALAAAVDAQADWAATTPRFRAELLRSAYDAVVANREKFATVISREMGKPLAEARTEVDYGADFLRWFGEETTRVGGRYQAAPDGNGRILTTAAPVGPCLLITPWNFPLAMLTRKVAPAIAAGCTMVVKPASLTPLTALLLAEVLNGLGLPRGVLNVITSSSASTVSQRLMHDRRLRKVSFTGSTPVGRTLLRLASDNIVRSSMELGGNAPFLVFADADLDRAVDGAVVAKMRNNGQSCVAANRFYVHRSIAVEFTDRLVTRLEALRFGPGTEPVDAGPLADEAQRDTVHTLVRAAVAGGAALRTGGEPDTGPGYFYPPTVLTSVPPDSPVLHNEIFGPVAPVVPFDTEDEAVSLANESEFGLAAYLFTENLDRALRLVDRLQVGMVGVNQGVVSNAAAPFGGVKASGLGREGGSEGIREYLDVRYAAISSPLGRP
ncbi:NAD-dependent succinate-semialdehyde dehydrogenase [Actinocrispum wychmicini]|uniref:Succinate-semialdehyde dehydrogenase/glutarate-semialdehyde dehydrogenase n=1 Tax=Actinocrispum wychmicini TaxID=1213861 RepID=A0A4R2JDR7_9PSEU|nr:NAD-dependent succinate-semialdehyde dehydrogenase [Actinocrispum wychmicini]TCO54349.1 succinate-semialdehyde dehydrogenase/glutarate-semialdehyde dehydrogenase [Actinocrispum wychmicini]